MAQNFTADYATFTGFTVALDFVPDDEGQGVINFGIYATDGGGSPTGGAIASGSFDIRATQTVSGLSVSLTPSSVYALVLDITNLIHKLRNWNSFRQFEKLGINLLLRQERRERIVAAIDNDTHHTSIQIGKPTEG